MAATKSGPRKSRSASAKQPDFPVVYVKYHDHCWLEAKDLERIQVAKPYVIEETGFLLSEAPRYITLAKERSTDGEKGKVQYDDVTIIMRSDILQLRVFDASQGEGESGGAGRAEGRGSRARGGA